LSAPITLQATQLEPFAPQLPSERGWHCVPLQQPTGHETPSQMQLPPTQRWPIAHCAAPPQRQVPLDEQLSANSGMHSWQIAPPVPQVAALEVAQVAPVQQPLGHEAALQPLHAPDSQLCPDGHAWQAPPPAPHAEVVLPGMQLLPAQQPFGQKMPLHTHCPLTHCWFGAHSGPEPHLQAPLAEQPSDW
jgi:hypothetical protein